MDLDERIVGPQRTREGPQILTAGGSSKILEVQNFAKGTASDHSQSLLSMKYGHNSEKLLGFGTLFFRPPAVEMSVYTSTGRGP